jgi:hypothetical protein
VVQVNQDGALLTFLELFLDALNRILNVFLDNLVQSLFLTVDDVFLAETSVELGTKQEVLLFNLEFLHLFLIDQLFFFVTKEIHKITPVELQV